MHSFKFSSKGDGSRCIALNFHRRVIDGIIFMKRGISSIYFVDPQANFLSQHLIGPKQHHQIL